MHGVLTLLSGLGVFPPSEYTGLYSMMTNVKASIDARTDNEGANGDIAAWLDTVSKQDKSAAGAFRKTLDSLLEG